MSKEKNSIFSSKLKYIGLAFMAVAVMVFAMSGLIQGESLKNGDLRILKSEVTRKARFYPYNAEGIKMEVIAVKASDGTIRTAFNTCQVCFDSGRGWYTQEDDELVCNNCGNRFQIDKVEKIKYGCNPIPITKENKTEDGKYIKITKDFLFKYRNFFTRWKR